MQKQNTFKHFAKNENFFANFYHSSFYSQSVQNNEGVLYVIVHTKKYSYISFVQNSLLFHHYVIFLDAVHSINLKYQ
jgi:hypothetical protein